MQKPTSAGAHALIESLAIAVNDWQWEGTGRKFAATNWGVPSTLGATNGQEVLNRLTSRIWESSDSPNGVAEDTRSLGGEAVHFRIFQRIVMPSPARSGRLLRFLGLEYEGTATRRNVGIHSSNDNASLPRRVKIFLDCLTLENMADRLSRNVGW
jgi:hypothetical protein